MNFSRCGEACPARASDFSGIVFTPCFKRNERRLTSKKPKWKRWKMSIKNVHGNLRSVVTSLYFCIGAYWLRINMNNSFSMELASQEPILPLLMKKLDGNNFYNLKLRLQRKSSRNRRGESWKDWPPLRGLPTDPRSTDYPMDYSTDYPTDYPYGLP